MHRNDHNPNLQMCSESACKAVSHFLAFYGNPRSQLKRAVRQLFASGTVQSAHPNGCKNKGRASLSEIIFACIRGMHWLVVVYVFFSIRRRNSACKAAPRGNNTSSDVDHFHIFATRNNCICFPEVQRASKAAAMGKEPSGMLHWGEEKCNGIGRTGCL